MAGRRLLSPPFPFRCTRRTARMDDGHQTVLRPLNRTWWRRGRGRGVCDKSVFAVIVLCASMIMVIHSTLHSVHSKVGSSLAGNDGVHSPSFSTRSCFPPIEPKKNRSSLACYTPGYGDEDKTLGFTDDVSTRAGCTSIGSTPQARSGRSSVSVRSSPSPHGNASPNHSHLTSPIAKDNFSPHTQTPKGGRTPAHTATASVTAAHSPRTATAAQTPRRDRSLDQASVRTGLDEKVDADDHHDEHDDIDAIAASIAASMNNKNHNNNNKSSNPPKDDHVDDHVDNHVDNDVAKADGVSHGYGYGYVQDIDWDYWANIGKHAIGHAVDFASVCAQKAKSVVGSWGSWGKDHAALITGMANLSISDSPAEGSVGDDVATLLEKYQYEILQLQANCHDVLTERDDQDNNKEQADRTNNNEKEFKYGYGGEQAPPYDDLFLLRYILQQKEEAGSISLPAIESAIRDTIKWNREHKEILYDVRREGLSIHPVHRIFETLTGVTRWKLNDGGWLDYISPQGVGADSSRELASRVTQKQLLDYLLVRKQMRFDQCDRATRNTGCFVKSLTVRDASKSSTLESLFAPIFEFTGQDGGLANVQRKAADLSHRMHPMLTDKIILVDAPLPLRLSFRALRATTGPRATGKVNMCDRMSVRALLKDRVPVEDLDLLFPESRGREGGGEKEPVYNNSTIAWRGTL
mmetsp:Transcript_10659/g.19448  ORF Transcript_10659/g.19448 Transcript_10659/m.19448 type:complete len:691 (-) Transcript_10659:160-2232(-)